MNASNPGILYLNIFGAYGQTRGTCSILYIVYMANVFKDVFRSDMFYIYCQNVFLFSNFQAKTKSTCGF